MIIPETWRIYTVVALVFLVIGAIGWLVVARANLRAELAQINANYTMCQKANTEWAEYANKYNEATHKMRRQAEKRKEETRKAILIAEENAKKHELLARKILSAKSSEDCKSAQNLVRNYLRERK